MLHALVVRRRVILPTVGGAVCLGVEELVPPILAFVLVIAAFGLFLDAFTSLWPQGDSLRKYRQ